MRFFKGSLRSLTAKRLRPQSCLWPSYCSSDYWNSCHCILQGQGSSHRSLYGKRTLVPSSCIATQHRWWMSLKVYQLFNWYNQGEYNRLPVLASKFISAIMVLCKSLPLSLLSICNTGIIHTWQNSYKNYKQDNIHMKCFEHSKDHRNVKYWRKGQSSVLSEQPRKIE